MEHHQRGPCQVKVKLVSLVKLVFILCCNARFHIICNYIQHSVNVEWGHLHLPSLYMQLSPATDWETTSTLDHLSESKKQIQKQNPITVKRVRSREGKLWPEMGPQHKKLKGHVFGQGHIFLI